MKKREDRRARTAQYAKAAQAIYHAFVCEHGCVCRSPHYKAKGKSLGCGCQRRRRGCGPKIAGGFCHGAGYGYHPCVVERIAGKRLARAWLSEIRGADPIDVDL